MSSVDRVLVPSLSPGSGHDLVLSVTSPVEFGVFSSQWRMSTFTGTPFGGSFNLVNVLRFCLFSGFFCMDFSQILFLFCLFRVCFGLFYVAFFSGDFFSDFVAVSIQRFVLILLLLFCCKCLQFCCNFLFFLFTIL